MYSRNAWCLLFVPQNRTAATDGAYEAEQGWVIRSLGIVLRNMKLWNPAILVLPPLPKEIKQINSPRNYEMADWCNCAVTEHFIHRAC